MNLVDNIISFVTVVEQGSFAKAAKLLNLSASSVSRQISELESNLKIELLRRNTHSLALTEFGSQYLIESKSLIDQYDSMKKMVLLTKQDPEGELKIQAPKYSFDAYILPCINEFCKLYPKVTPVIEIADRAPDFESENIGVVFGASIWMEPNIKNHRNIIRRHVFDANLVVCGTPEYLAEFGTPKSLRALSDHRIIAPIGRKDPDILLLISSGALNLDPCLYLNDIDSMIKCAEQHIGLIRINELYITKQLQSGALVEVLPKYRQKIQIFMYYRKSRHLDQKISKFVDFILSYSSRKDTKLNR